MHETWESIQRTDDNVSREPECMQIQKLRHIYDKISQLYFLQSELEYFIFWFKYGRSTLFRLICVPFVGYKPVPTSSNSK